MNVGNLLSDADHHIPMGQSARTFYMLPSRKSALHAHGLTIWIVNSSAGVHRRRQADNDVGESAPPVCALQFLDD